MSSGLTFVDYVVIGIMLTISAGVGLYFRFTGGRQKTTQEYLMADKNMAILPVSFSIMATAMSAITLLGTPAEVYFYGGDVIIKDIFILVGMVLAAYFIVPVYFDSGSNTIYEYLEKRFGKGVKFASTLLYSVQMILYMPVVLYAPSLALSTVTGFSTWTCVISMASVCTFYSALGGLKAVLWTDFFQGIIMLFTNFSLIIKGFLDFGGLSEMIEIMRSGGRLDMFKTSMHPTVRYSVWNTMLFGTILGTYYYGAIFTIIQRLTSCGNVKKAQRALLWTVPLTFMFKMAADVVGLVIYAYFHDCDPIRDKTVKITKGDQLVPYFIITLFGHLPGLPGLCIAGILSAALSTLSSIVNSLAAVTVEDYMKPYAKCKNFSDSTATIFAKVLAIFYGGFCLLLAFVVADVKGVTEAAFVFVGMIGGPTFGVFWLGMFTTTANELGSLVGLAVGFSLNAWMGFGSLYNGLKYPPLPLSTDGCAAYSNSSLSEALYSMNSTMGLDVANITNLSHRSITEERYVFPLYKVSYMWSPTIAFVTTVIVGYIASLISALWTEKRIVDPLQLSPVVRKWLIKVPLSSTKKECIALSHERKKADK